MYNVNGMKTIAVNKKARFNYFITDEIEAGIVLEGSEVKSIRSGNVSLNESFVIIQKDEIFLKNAYIKPYEKAGVFIPDSRRNRKLLLSKQEILKLEKKIEAQGFTILPLKIYLKGNFVKVQIGVGKGKKLYDKREDLKEKTIKKDLQRKSYI